MTTKTKTRADREAALAVNVRSPIRTPLALERMSEAELKNLEVHVAKLDAANPDPYGAAWKAAPRVAQSSDDPSYQPFGAAPDGYAIHLTEADNKKEAK